LIQSSQKTCIAKHGKLDTSCSWKHHQFTTIIICGEQDETDVVTAAERHWHEAQVSYLSGMSGSIKGGVTK